MKFKLIMTLAISMMYFGCASGPYKEQRRPSSVADTLNVSLTDIISANSGYWSVEKKDEKGNKKSYYGRYKAFIIDSADEFKSLFVFAETNDLKPAPQIGDVKKPMKIEKQNDDSKFTLIAENKNFLWGSDWAGTEPSLAVNGRGSLLIKSGNEGIGRTSWTDQVVVRLNPLTAALEVIGYDYQSFDKINGSSMKCSYNLNTGSGVIEESSASWDKDGNEIKPKVKVKRVKVSTQKVNINDFKSPYEMPQFKDCLVN